MIGTGWFADFLYLPSLKSHPNVILAGICGRDQERADILARKFGVTRVFKDYHEMLNNGELDAVVVSTPDDLHYPMVMEAIKAGLHVICEKPMALTAAQAKEMYENAEMAVVKHMVMFTNRGLPHFRYIKRLLEEGYIGRPYLGQFHWLTGVHRNGDEYMWNYDPKRSNGVVGYLGSHMIDLARWYMGEITRVSASLSSFVRRPGVDGRRMETANDTATLMVEFANGARASLLLSTVICPGVGLRQTGQTVNLHGQKGTLETRADPYSIPPISELTGFLENAQEAVELTVPREFFGSIDRNAWFETFKKFALGPRLFIDSILLDLTITPNFYDGYKVQQVIEAALESHKSGRAVTISG